MHYTFQFGVLWEYAPYIAKGIWFTLKISFWSIFWSTIIGIILASIQISKNKALRTAAIVYIDIFRTIPLVCLLIWIHYVLPILAQTDLSPVQSSILALSLNGGALASEAFRGGMEAIPHTQIQAAHSLGFTQFGTLRHVIVPQAIYSTLPPLTNVYITTIENVTITMIVAVPEVMLDRKSVV